MLSNQQQKAIKEKAINILQHIYDTYPLFKNFIYSKGMRDTWFPFKNQVLRDIDTNLMAVNGSYRGVIIDESFDWVIKFDFREEINESYVGNCHSEVFLYEYAAAYNMDEYFAPCFYGGEWKGISFYLMKKVHIDEDLTSDEMGSIDIYQRSDEEMSAEDEQALVNVFSNYFSYKDVTQLVDFCKFHGIKDFHAANIGYSAGHPILIDYASY